MYLTAIVSTTPISTDLAAPVVPDPHLQVVEGIIPETEQPQAVILGAKVMAVAELQDQAETGAASFMMKLILSQFQIKMDLEISQV